MTALVLAVNRQLHAIVPLVVQHKVHVVDLVRVGLVNGLFHHLSGHHVQVVHHVIGWQVLVGSQLEPVVFLHAAVAHEDERSEVLYDALIAGVLVDKSSLSPPLVPRLGDAPLVELHTVLQGGHVQVVASGVEVLVASHADAPSVSQRRRDIGIYGLTAEVVQRIVDLPLKAVACQFRLTVHSIGNGTVFQHHILRCHGAGRLMAHAAMPGFIGIDLQHIVGYWKTILKDGGPLVGGQSQGDLPGL